MFPGRQAWLVLNQDTAESLLVYIASITADYCPCISLIKIYSAYKIYYHSCVVLNHARQGYFWIVPEWVIAQCWLILRVNLDDSPYPNSIQGPSASGTISCLKLLHVQQGEMSIVHGIIDLRDTLESSRPVRVLRNLCHFEGPRDPS